MLDVGRVPRLRNTRSAVKVECLACGTLGTFSSRSCSLDASPLTTRRTSLSPSPTSFHRSFVRIEDIDRPIAEASLHRRYDTLIRHAIRAPVSFSSLLISRRRKEKWANEINRSNDLSGWHTANDIDDESANNSHRRSSRNLHTILYRAHFNHLNGTPAVDTFIFFPSIQLAVVRLCH